MRLLCLDFGGSSIKYGILDTETGNLGEKGSLKNTFASREEMLEAVISIAEQQTPICGVAISYCGELDHHTGFIYSPGSYLYNRNLPMKQVLEDRLHVPVSVENDGNCAMLAESRYGVLKGYENACMVVLGTGIAGALILNGQLHTGKRGFAGIFSLFQSDISHPFGLENTATSTVAAAFLMREYLRRTGRPLPEDLLFGACMLDGEPFDGRKFFQLLEEGDPDADAALDQYASNVCNLLINIMVTIEPEAFAIGGGISQQPELIDRIRQKMDLAFQEDSFFTMVQFPKPEIFAASFGNDANLVGAAEWFKEINK